MLDLIGEEKYSETVLDETVLDEASGDAVQRHVWQCQWQPPPLCWPQPFRMQPFSVGDSAIIAVQRNPREEGKDHSAAGDESDGEVQLAPTQQLSSLLTNMQP